MLSINEKPLVLFKEAASDIFEENRASYPTNPPPGDSLFCHHCNEGGAEFRCQMHTCNLAYCGKCLMRMYRYSKKALKKVRKMNNWGCPSCRKKCVCNNCKVDTLKINKQKGKGRLLRREVEIIKKEFDEVKIKKTGINNASHIRIKKDTNDKKAKPPQTPYYIGVTPSLVSPSQISPQENALERNRSLYIPILNNSIYFRCVPTLLRFSGILCPVPLYPNIFHELVHQDFVIDPNNSKCL